MTVNSITLNAPYGNSGTPRPGLGHEVLVTGLPEMSVVIFVAQASIRPSLSRVPLPTMKPFVARIEPVLTHDPPSTSNWPPFRLIVPLFWKLDDDDRIWPPQSRPAH